MASTAASGALMSTASGGAKAEKSAASSSGKSWLSSAKRFLSRSSSTSSTASAASDKPQLPQSPSLQSPLAPLDAQSAPAKSPQPGVPSTSNLSAETVKTANLNNTEIGKTSRTAPRTRNLTAAAGSATRNVQSRRSHFNLDDDDDDEENESGGDDIDDWLLSVPRAGRVVRPTANSAGLAKSAGTAAGTPARRSKSPVGESQGLDQAESRARQPASKSALLTVPLNTRKASNSSPAASSVASAVSSPRSSAPPSPAAATTTKKVSPKPTTKPSHTVASPSPSPTKKSPSRSPLSPRLSTPAAAAAASLGKSRSPKSSSEAPQKAPERSEKISSPRTSSAVSAAKNVEPADTPQRRAKSASTESKSAPTAGSAAVASAGVGLKSASAVSASTRPAPRGPASLASKSAKSELKIDENSRFQFDLQVKDMERCGFKLLKTIGDAHSLKATEGGAFDPVATWQQPCDSASWIKNHGIQAQNLRAEVLEASTNIKELEQARTTLRILRTMVSKRMQWLSSGSHGAFGCVTSQRVAVAVDLLAAHASSQSAIVQDLSKLLSEQLAGREVWWLPLGHKLADGEHCDLHFPEAIARSDTWIRALPQMAHADTVNNAGEKLAASVKRAADTLGSSVASAARGTAATAARLGKILTGSRRAALEHNEDEHTAADASGDPSGPDLLRAMERALTLVKDSELQLDIYVVLHSMPMQGLAQLRTQLRPLLSSAANRHRRFHFIAYCASHAAVVKMARLLARDGHGSYCVVESDGVYSSFLAELETEDKAIQQLLKTVSSRLKEIIRAKSAAESEKRAQAKAERSSSEKKEKAKKPHASSQLDPAVRKRPLRPPAPTRSLRLRQTSDSKNGTGHRYEDNIKELERTVQQQSDHPTLADAPGDEPGKEMSSSIWLAEHGLEARHLTPYHALSDVAYTCYKPGVMMGEKYKSTATMKWRDGSLRTVHVDPVSIMQLRRKIEQHIMLIQRRMEWLGTGSRRVFGNIVEPCVTLVIDCSSSMAPFWHQMLQHLKLVLTEQLRYKSFFNVIFVDHADCTAFAADFCKVDRQSLRAAWQWIKDWRPAQEPAEGRPNLSAAMQLALRQQAPGQNCIHSVYVVLSKVPAGSPADLGVPEQKSSTAATDTGAASTSSRKGGSLSTTASSATLVAATAPVVVHACAYNSLDQAGMWDYLHELTGPCGGRLQFILDERTPHEVALSPAEASWAIYPPTFVAQVAMAESVPEPPQHLSGEDRESPATAAHKQLAAWMRLRMLATRQRLLAEELAAEPANTMLLRDAAAAVGHTFSACLCSSTDFDMLAQEVATARDHLEVLDQLLIALPPDYALRVFEVAAKQGSPVAPELVARVQALAKIEAEREAQEVEAKLAAEEEEKARLRREAEEERAEREAQRLAALQKLRRTADAPKVASPSKTPGSQMKLRYMTINTPMREAERLGLERSVASTSQVAPSDTMSVSSTSRTDMPATAAQQPELTKSWLKRHGLSRNKLTMEKFLATNSMLSAVQPTHGSGGDGTATSSKQANHLGRVFTIQRPSSRKTKDGRPAVWYVMATPRDLSEYRSRLRLAIERLEQRLHYLQAGPERLLGQVLAPRVALAIDISGSIFSSLPTLKTAVADLLQHVVQVRCQSFALVCFNDELQKLTPCMLPVSADAIAAAVEWLSQRQAQGGTRLQPLLEYCLSELQDVDAVHLVTDGLTEETPQQLLALVDDCYLRRPVSVNTVSLNCDDAITNGFLKELSAATQGVFKTVMLEQDSGREAIGGDDFELLQRELQRARDFDHEAAALQTRIAENIDDSASVSRVSQMESTQPKKPAWNEGDRSKRRQRIGTSAALRSEISQSEYGYSIAPTEMKSTRSMVLRQQWHRLQRGQDASSSVRSEAEPEKDFDDTAATHDDENDVAALLAAVDQAVDSAANLDRAPDTHALSDEQDENWGLSRHANVRRVAAALDDLEETASQRASQVWNVESSSVKAGLSQEATSSVCNVAEPHRGVSINGERAPLRHQMTSTGLVFPHFKPMHETLEPRVPQAGPSVLPPHSLFLNNISCTGSETDIANFFITRAGVRTAFIRIPWDSQAGCNATYAYVSFATEHDAKQALKCDGQVFQGLNVKISPAAEGQEATLVRGSEEEQVRASQAVLTVRSLPVAPHPFGLPGDH